jgi:F-type H+-transporting ATPase subunit b
MLKRIPLRILWMVLITAGLALAQEAEKGGAAPEPDLTVWRWANFVILAAGLGYLVMKSLPAMFRARTVEIQKGIAEAQTVKAAAEKRARDIETKLLKLGSEVETLRTEAKAEIEQEGKRIQEETVAAVKKIETQAAAEIESAGKIARLELKKYAAELALDLAAKRIQAGLDSGTEAGLVDSFLDDLSKQELSKQGSKN